MKLSLDWLSQFLVWTEKDPQAIARRLTLSVAEIEGVEMQGALLEQCCVGKIVAVLPHPNASKLRLADVETDRGTLRVVCGGTNLAEGMLVAFAHIGATVRWHGEGMQTLAPAVIRGEESKGMICAGEELDLQEMFPATPDQGERPILDLTPLKLTPGTPLREALGLQDVIFDVNNTAITNRPDLFSHLGFARECVAAGLAKWKGGKEPQFTMPKGTKAAPTVRLSAMPKQAVTRYLACVIEIDAPGETPAWMKRRLSATGFRPLLLPVDITNYVSHEVGMPLHSFDIDDLRGPVRCRFTEANETLVTLDGAEHKLPQDTLVLTDDEGNFDLMGIMGGLRSSTKASTRRIYLHSAVVEPSLIRKTTAALNQRTDASTVYEKGIPSVTAEWGFARAVQLFLELVPGARVVSSVESAGKDDKPAAIAVHEEHLSRISGDTVKPGDAKRILAAVGCTVKAGKTGTWAVTPPPWRTKDLKIEEDLIDEVTRLHGYDRMTPTVPLAPISLPERDFRSSRMRHALAAAGYAEILPLSLLSPASLERCGLQGAPRRALQSPLSEDLSLLQPSTLPGMLEHAERNLLHVHRALKTFRICTVFSKTEEHLELGALHVARTEHGLSDDPLLLLKEQVSHALRALGYNTRFREAIHMHPWMHPGKCAEVCIDDTVIGHLSAVHPDVCVRYGLPTSTAACLLHWSSVLAMTPAQKPVRPTPAFPAIVYDTTVARTHGDAVGPLLSALRHAHPLVESVQVQDLYKHPREDHYRLTLRCTYRAADRTLTEEEARSAHETLLKAGNLSPIG